MAETNSCMETQFYPPSCSSLGPLNNILPRSPSELLSVVPKLETLGPAYTSKVTSAAEHMYTKQYSICIENCDVLIDHTWERLNTGHWKDINITWRYAYTLVSLLKALSQCALLSDSNSNINHLDILKTCDMGLLMGAPIMDNILAKMSRKFQESFGNRRLSVSADELSKEEDAEETVPRKLAKRDKQEATELAMSASENISAPIDGQENSQSVEATAHNGREVPRYCCPSVEMFHATFFDLQHPVVITDAIGYWPALTSHKWSLRYLRRIAGSRTVPVEIGSRYTDEDWTQKLMTVNEFIDQYVTNPQPGAKGYLAQHNLFDQVRGSVHVSYDGVKLFFARDSVNNKSLRFFVSSFFLSND